MESELVKACCQYLTMKSVFHYRQNTGAYAIEGKTGRRFVRFGTPGAPDIIAVINGKYVGIECKVKNGKQSPNQIEFEKKLKQAGGEYWLIRSIEELVLKLV